MNLSTGCIPEDEIKTSSSDPIARIKRERERERDRYIRLYKSINIYKLYSREKRENENSVLGGSFFLLGQAISREMWTIVFVYLRTRETRRYYTFQKCDLPGTLVDPIKDRKVFPCTYTYGRYMLILKPGTRRIQTQSTIPRGRAN